MDEILNCHFTQSISNLRSQIIYSHNDFFNSLGTLNHYNTIFTFNYTTQDEVRDIILNLSPNKSCGHDNVSPNMLINCVDELTPYLVTCYNNMITKSTYPNILKIHKITPIPKEKNATNPDMYRPIAVLSIINNIFERILYNQIASYMYFNKLLNDFQYGFRKGCGTEEAVVNVIRFVCKSLDDGHNGVAAIFYDFSKAFDLVDHGILLEKLKFYGFHGKNISLIKSYLANREQFVQIGGYKSSLRSVLCGVPQGSVLGPLLFTIFINDLHNLGLTGKMFMYADDICLFYPYKHETAVKAYMERDAALICEFARINRLILNANKTQLLRFKISRPNDIFSVMVDGKEIFEVRSTKYLGINIQNNLAWDNHIQALKMKLSQSIGILYKFKNKFEKETKILIYHATIQSHLNYLAISYAYKKTNGLKSLQRMQNKALKLVYNLPLLYPTISLYVDTCQTILPIHGLYKMQLLTYVFKCVHNIGHHTIQFVSNDHTINTRNNGNLRTTLCRYETTKQRIDYMGSREYNNLPQNLRSETRISVFKKLLKEYILHHVNEILA